MACRAPKSDSTNSLTRLEELELLSNGLPHRKRRARPASPAPWSKAYVNLCMLGALMAGCAPLAVVLTHMSVVFLATDDDGAPGGGACPVDRGDLATNGTMLVRGAGHVALVTLSDEGPRGETRRLTRLALANKRAYASAHNYSLVVFDAPDVDIDDVQVRFAAGTVHVRIDRTREHREGFEMRFPGRGMTLDGHVYAADFILISDEFYQSLTPAQQAVVARAARIAGNMGRSIQQWSTAEGVNKVQAEQFDNIFAEIHNARANSICSTKI